MFFMPLLSSRGCLVGVGRDLTPSLLLQPSSAACTPCEPGTYSLSWGSSHCKHCIAGTYASKAQATACRMCPEATTTTEDGQPACNVTLAPATNLDRRYAVVVYFSVYLTGIDLESIVLKVRRESEKESCGVFL